MPRCLLKNWETVLELQAAFLIRQSRGQLNRLDGGRDTKKYERKRSRQPVEDIKESLQLWTRRFWK